MKKLCFVFVLSVVLLNPAWAQDYQSLYKGMVSDKEFQAKDKTILLFWSSRCPYCRQSIHSLKNKCGELKDEGYHLYLIDGGERRERVESFIKKEGITCPVLLDTEGDLGYIYQVLGVPTYVFLYKGKEIDRANYLNENILKMVYGKR